MRIASPQKRAAAESVIPMINVVFLLLIFFLMTAQITPPEPFEVSPPAAELDTPADGQDILHVSAEGDLAYKEARGEADVLAALAGYPENEPLMLRADRAVSAQEIAALLPKLAAAGVRDLKLVSTLQ